MMATPSTRMTVSDIAELAGVQRSTVSNWQRRHDEFPKPLPDSPPGRPQFDASTVQAWLTSRGFEPAGDDRASELVRTWRYMVNHVDYAAGDEPLVIFIAAITGLLPEYGASSDERYPVAISVPDLDTTVYATRSQADAIQHFLATELAGVDKAELIEAASRDFDEQIRWRRGPETAEAERNLHNLLAELVHDETRAVLDFACGTGALLTATARKRPQSKYVGVTPGLVEHFIAQARLECYADAGVEHSDILEVDALAGRTFDAVVSIPPFGIRIDSKNDRLRRLPFGPVRGTADAAWPQLAVQALGADGEAFLVLPHNLATSDRADRMRRGLIQLGALAAIVTLPPNANPDSKTLCDLWILSKRQASGADILFVDYSAGDATDVKDYALLASALCDWIDDGPLESSERLPEGDPRFVPISPIKLLGQTVTLDPLFWCARAASPTSAPELIDAVEQAAAALDGARHTLIAADTPPCLLVPDQQALITIRAARGDGLLDIVRRGIPPQGGRDASDNRIERPILRVADVEAMWRGEPVEYDVDSKFGRDPFTHLQFVRHGDVLVWVTPDRQIRATVCTVSGLAPSGSITALRCNPEELDPVYLALTLAAGHNAMHITGSNLPGLRGLDLSFPLISIDRQRQLAHYAQTAQQVMTAARNVAAAAEAFQQALADAAGSGSVAIATEAGDQ
ncbi:N-6 DNA methylase [Mycolicibacter algericus]|nr:N-6 DNA methylase [Mycolicibacter algericus]